MGAAKETRAARPAPWEAVSSKEQLFVLVTGANSGVGLGTAQRLIDEFLSTRSPTSHLVLLPTTRSSSKCRQTVQILRDFAAQALAKKAGESIADGEKKTTDASKGRIHILSLPLDLCDLREVHALADSLCRGTVSNPPGLEDEYLVDVRIPKIDAIVCNAAYGGWTGVSYPGAVWALLTVGPVQAFTWPDFKQAAPTCLLNERPSYKYPPKPLLSEVFTACLFGHYCFAHYLLPLLSRRRGDPTESPPGRIIWSSSLEAQRDSAAAHIGTDIQCIEHNNPYDSSKRVIDLLSISATLPAARRSAQRFLTYEDGNSKEDLEPPRMYVSHPGILATTLFPLPWFFFWLYELAMAFSRWLGSPWHTLTGYNGGKAGAWLVLEDQAHLDNLNAERVKWGSGADRDGQVFVKRTEVGDWGWGGRVEDVTAQPDGEEGEADGSLSLHELKKMVGRKAGALDATLESIADFEEVGADVWDQLEAMRTQWEDILGIGAGSRS